MDDAAQDRELSKALAAALSSVDPTVSERIDDDPQAHLDLVLLTWRAHEHTGVMLGSAVAAARTAGWSWEAIGSSLGMSRQAAQQRFGRPSEAVKRGLGADEIERKRLVGLNATNEMEKLDAVGRHGWHSVGYGPLFHDIEKSDLQWEHRRAFVGSGKARELEEAGWERIGTMWFPWVYLKRSLGVPALAEPEDDQ